MYTLVSALIQIPEWNKSYMFMYYCKTIIIQNLHILLLLLRKHIRDQIGTLVEPLRADESVVLFHRQETKPKVIFVYKLLILLDDKLNI